jgi:hypothetical protein
MHLNQRMNGIALLCVGPTILVTCPRAVIKRPQFNFFSMRLRLGALIQPRDKEAFHYGTPFYFVVFPTVNHSP